MRSQYPNILRAAALATVVLGLQAGAVQAASPAAGGLPQSPRASAPIDLTGQWVAIVNEEWRWRMVTPPKGDYASVAPLMTAEARRVAGEWTPAEDGSCKAYGAAGLMRLPLRVRISWEGDDVLKLETDVGQQVRRLRFGAGAAAGPASLQGHSVAQWERTLRAPGGGAAAPQPEGGSLLVRTGNLVPGWLRRNGVPYGDKATVTEYFDRFRTPAGDEWFVVTTVVEDPVYLNGRFITSSNFRREADATKWYPKPCK